jgi:hypothetical protein
VRDDEMHKDPEAAAALVSARGETPGALGPLVITQSMRSLFRLTRTLNNHTTFDFRFRALARVG